MRIFLVGIGLDYHVGAFFSNALKQLDYDHLFFDEQNFFNRGSHSLFYRIFNKIFKKPPTYWQYNRSLLNSFDRYKPGIMIVTKGAYINKETLLKIKRSYPVILVNYATDDPFNPAITTKDLIEGIPCYDLFASTKRAIIDDLKSAGCKNVVFIPFGYDPSYHYPEKLTLEQEINRFTSDMVFIGGADLDRISLINKVITNIDVNLHLYGNYWQRHEKLNRVYRGFVYGEEYRKALSGTKIGLCLVRHANRDGHAMRTFEIPACGTFMLAERTEEHLEFFEEDKEFVCFNSVDELMDKTRFYLSHERERKIIAQSGYERVRRDNNTYMDRMQTIIDTIKKML